MSPSISNLPEEILELICQKLINIKDYARFGAVCTQWRLVLYQSWKKMPSPQPPVCFLLHTQDHIKFHHSYLFPTNTYKEYVLNSTKEKIIYFGSSHGWLITDGITLVNPFLSVNNVIRLPSFDIDRSYMIMMFVLSDNPIFTPNYMVMVKYLAYHGSNYELAFIKSGDKHWTHIHEENSLSSYDFTDVICHKQQFYAVTSYGEEVVCVDVTSSSTDQPYKLTKLGSPNRSNSPYLVESAGELLFVAREYNNSLADDCGSLPRTTGFQIFKLEARKQEWIEVKTLGGHALFLGWNSSISVLASDHPFCRPDHIYFTQEYRIKITAFSLKLGRFEELLHVPGISISRSIWVQPTLNVTETCKLLLPPCIKDSHPSVQPTCVSDTTETQVWTLESQEMRLD